VPGNQVRLSPFFRFAIAQIAPADYALRSCASIRNTGAWDDADVAPLSWRADALAAVMIIIAVYSAGRLAFSLLRHRETEFDADGVHVVMGLAMAGMFLPRLSPLPDRAWEAMFGIGTAWFAWQAIRIRRGHPCAGWRCPHPLPHLVECIAMLYMFLALPGSRAAGSAVGMPMPGMSGAAGGTGNLPALPVVLALFMVGYVVWAADQVTSVARRRNAAATPSLTAGSAGFPRAAAAPGTASARRSSAVHDTASTAGVRGHDSAGRPILAPRLAAGSKIAMSITMGYMLMLMI